MHAKAALLALCIAVTACLWAAASASAYETNGVAVSEFATGFYTVNTSGGRLGPIGVALDHQNRLYVTDQADGWLYRFDGSGPADSAHRVGSAPIGHRPAGIAFDSQDHLYVVRYGEKDVVQVDPNTGAILRTVVSGLHCPFGLAPDPISGDLFLTEPACNSNLMRIVNVASPAPFVVPFATGFSGPDGITSTPDGTVYVVETIPGRVVQVAGTASGTPGQKTTLATLSGADGLAIGAGSGSTPPFVIVNRTNGSITRVDLANGTQSNTDLVTGGSRGDFPAVGFDGCMYATQTNLVLKVTDPNGTCGQGAGLLGNLLPSTPPRLSGGSNALRLPSSKGCVDRRKFTFKLHHARRTRIVQVDAFVNGKRKVHLRRHSITRITLKKLPKGKFRVRIVARQSNGSRKISKRTYKGCTKSKPTTRSKKHRRRHR
ncbi:MAG: SMP-30/gluconolactonase/LRE family protein [Gaiellaceae bacterium]